MIPNKGMKTLSLPCLRPVVLLVLFALIVSNLPAQLREFTSPYGVKMKFELVSHNGTGKSVTLKTEKGEVKQDMVLTAFSAADQEFIKAWIAKTPATIDHKFRWEAKKTRVSGVNNGSKTGTSRTAKWAYDLTLVNDGRTPVSDLVVKYQIHRASKFDARYSSYRYQGLKPLMKFSGSAVIEKELTSKAKAEFQTILVEVVTVDEDYGYYDRRDSIVGIHLRIYDKDGRMVHEERTEGVKDASWDGEKGKPTVIR